MENVPALCIGMADGCSSCAGEGRAAQPELVASAQELMRMLQVIEGEILPRTAKGVAAGNKASPTLLACIPPLRRPSRWPGPTCCSPLHL